MPGADDYIAKSDDFTVLRARLRAPLRRKQFEDEYRLMREELHVSDSERRASLGAEAQVQVLAHFDLRRMIARHESLHGRYRDREPITAASRTIALTDK